MNRKLKGDIGEAQVLLHFVKNGDEIYKPFGDNAKYDFIVRRKNQLLKVSVKYCGYKEKNSWYVNLRQTHQFEGKTTTIPFNNTEYDLVIVYLVQEDRVLEINSSSIKSIHGIKIPVL